MSVVVGKARMCIHARECITRCWHTVRARVSPLSPELNFSANEAMQEVSALSEHDATAQSAVGFGQQGHWRMHVGWGH